MAALSTPHLCSLASAVGKKETCPEESCPFWEPGGAVLEGRCALERIDFNGRAPVAELLLETRARLAAASSAEEARAELTLLHHLLNESSE